MTDTFEPESPARVPDAEGSADQAPLVYALVHALDRAVTGDMVFKTPGGETHTVTFFEGAPVRVEPGSEGERIGDELVAMDHLTEEALAEGLKASQSSRRRLGDILVRAEALDPSALTQALLLQTAKRLAALANLPEGSTFGLYFSARAEPEAHAPWAPLDTLLAAIRAWADRSRLHGTLRWLAKKELHLSPDCKVESVMLTSREREAVAMMRAEAPSLKALYASVGNGLSSLLYMLAVTRQFEFSAAKGPPMGKRAETDLVRAVVQVAVPIAPVIAPAPYPEGEDGGDRGSEPPPPEAPPPQEAAAAKKLIAVPADQEDGPAAPPVRVAPPPPSIPRPTPAPFVVPRPSPPVATAAAAPPIPPAPVPGTSPPVAAPPSPIASPSQSVLGAPAAAASPSQPALPSPAPPRPAARPSYSPPKFVDPGKPPTRIVANVVAAGGSDMSAEFHRAEEAAKRQDFETAERILQERCTEDDTAAPDFQALSCWVRANRNAKDVQAALNDLTFLLMAHNACEGALYYRGMLLKRTGKEKAALRDFVVLVKKNPNHAPALAEIKLLRDGAKK